MDRDKTDKHVQSSGYHHCSSHASWKSSLHSECVFNTVIPESSSLRIGPWNGNTGRLVLFILPNRLLNTSQSAQPFLLPVPPSEHDFFLSLLAPVRVTIAVVRSVVVIVIAVLHFILVNVLCTLFVSLRSHTQFSRPKIRKLDTSSPPSSPHQRGKYGNPKPACPFCTRFSMDPRRAGSSQARVRLPLIIRYLLFVKASPRKLSDTNWSPKAGDIIVSNWSSWIDILWLSYRYMKRWAWESWT